MLNQMRALSQNWIGRSIMAIVLGFIIVSFAVWGIGDRFSNFNASELAQVGSGRITVDDYRNAYQNQLQRLQEKERRGITNEEARRLGIDRQVLSRLLTDSILDQQARRLGLAVSDAEVARSIVADDMFKGASGKFDQLRFAALLRENGLNESTYVKEQRSLVLRQDVSDAVIGGLVVPKALEEAVHRYQSEVRDVSFFVLPPSAAGDIPKPSDKDLQGYYDEHGASFVAPEYRKLTVLSVVPANLIDPNAVSDADVKKRYDEMKDARFVVPEKREVSQLVFADAKAADAAHAKLDAGESFDKLVADEKKSPSDVSLGTVAKSEIADPAVAAAAFAMPSGGTSKPVKGEFGTVLVHVGQISPMRQQPLAEVSGQLKDELAIVRAKSKANDLRDKIEDQRTAGKTLAEAAASVGLKTRPIDAIDAQGRDRSHKPVEGLVDGPALLKAAFSSDVGADTEMLQTSNGGDVWYEVAGSEPSHKLPLAEVKAQVEKGWHNAEIAHRLADESDRLVKAIDAGTSLRDVAAAHGKLHVMQARYVGHEGAPNLAPSLAAAMFDVPVGKAGSAFDPGQGRAVFKVDTALVPPIDSKDEAFTKLMAQVKTGFEDDVMSQYLAKVQGEIGVKINQPALQSVMNSDDAGS